MTVAHEKVLEEIVLHLKDELTGREQGDLL